MTGGNVGAATGSSVAGNILSSATLNSVKQWADANSSGDPKLAMALTSAIAAAGGAAAGGAIGGGSGALNGADISSALQQYNMAIFLQQEALIAAGGALLLVITQIRLRMLILSKYKMLLVIVLIVRLIWWNGDHYMHMLICII